MSILEVIRNELFLSAAFFITDFGDNYEIIEKSETHEMFTRDLMMLIRPNFRLSDFPINF